MLVLVVLLIFISILLEARGGIRDPKVWGLKYHYKKTSI